LALALLPGILIIAQAPQAFKYQAIARDKAGNILINNDIGLRISMVEVNRDGIARYVETHEVKSNPFGMINLVIGEGRGEKGEFSDINWGEDSYFVKIEMDITGGTDYAEMGTSQLYAVPYALYAENAGQIKRPQTAIENSGSYGSKTNNKKGGIRNGTINSKVSSNDDSFLNALIGNVGIGTDLPAYKLDVIGDINATNFYTNGTLLKGSKWSGETDIYYTGGMVGIGKTSPTTALDVNGVITATGGSSSNWNTAFSWGDHALAGYLTSYTETDPKVLSSTENRVPKWNGTDLIDGSIYDNGNVGIGTTSPIKKLDVNGNINMAADSALMIDNIPVLHNKGTGNIFVGDSSGTNNITGVYNTALGLNQCILAQPDTQMLQ